MRIYEKEVQECWFLSCHKCPDYFVLRRAGKYNEYQKLVRMHEDTHAAIDGWVENHDLWLPITWKICGG